MTQTLEASVNIELNEQGIQLVMESMGLSTPEEAVGAVKALLASGIAEIPEILQDYIKVSTFAKLVSHE